MYRNFEVTRFRCFKSLSLPQLDRVNLITGKNNVGKTALLEAIFILTGGYRPDLAFTVNAYRGLEITKVELGDSAETPWVSFFSEFNTVGDLVLSADWDDRGKQVLRMRVVRNPEDLAEVGRIITPPGQMIQFPPSTAEGIHVLELVYEERGRKSRHFQIFHPGGPPRTVPIPPAPPLPSFFHGARIRVPFHRLAEQFATLQIHGEEGKLQEVLKLIESRLESVAMVFVASQPILHGRINGSRPIPLPLMGEGMVRLAELVITIGNARNGVVLVDEIENELHYTVLPRIWKALGEAARFFNTQLFCTTHSRECIVAAYEAFAKADQYDFLLHRLEATDGVVRAMSYDQEKLAAAVETNFEVR